MGKELEDLKAKWIIEKIDFDEKMVGRYVKRLMPFCKITKNGEIFLTDEGKKLSLKDQVGLTLVARFIAHILDDSIPEEVSAEEVSKIFLVDRMQVYARFKDTKNEKLAISVKRGIYKANPSRIEKFLDDIEKMRSWENK